jgi:hypothetical protein
MHLAHRSRVICPVISCGRAAISPLYGGTVAIGREVSVH